MGNGFTFELETLIFYAIAKAACIQSGAKTGYNSLSVYGDDVIIPSAAVSKYLTCFEAVGFEVNMSKSFFAGPFRESCGEDFFNGTDVRPVFVRDELSPLQLYTLHNQLVVSGISLLLPTLHNAILVLLRSKFKTELNFGPWNGSDGHLIDLTYCELCPFYTYQYKTTYAPLEKDVHEKLSALRLKISKALRRVRPLKIKSGNKHEYKNYKQKSFVKKALDWVNKKLILLDRYLTRDWFSGNSATMPLALYHLQFGKHGDVNTNPYNRWSRINQDNFLGNSSNDNFSYKVVDIPYMGRLYANKESYRLVRKQPI